MLVYYLRDLGAEPIVVGVYRGAVLRSELIGSPLFGILSDRVGHRRMMLIGPAFGAVAVIITAFTATSRSSASRASWKAGRRRRPCRRSSGSSPFATAGNELMRGKAVGTVRGRHARRADGRLRRRRSCIQGVRGVRAAFFLNAILYGVSFLDLPLGVPRRRAGAAQRRAARPARPRRPASAATSDPAWAATCGSWPRPGSPSTPPSGCSRARRCSSSSRALAAVRGPGPDGRLRGPVVSAGLAIGGLLFFAGLLLGRPVQGHAPDDDHPLRDRRAARRCWSRPLGINHSAG